MNAEPHTIWKRWTRVIVRRPKLIIGLGLTVAAVMGFVAASTPYDLSFTGLLDMKDPEVIAYKDAVRTFGASSALLLLLEGEPEALGEVTRRLAAELPERTGVQRVVPQADPRWLQERAPWFWPEGLFEAVLREAPRAQPSALTLNAVRAADELLYRTVRPSERARLVSLELAGDPLDMAMGGGDYRRIERATREILGDFEGRVTGDFTGITALAAQDQNQVFTRVRILTPLTLLVVLILLRFVETRITRVLAAGVALGGSVLIAFGGSGLILGRLSITATFFGMLLLGLGIDFAIHLLVALRDGRARGLTAEEALGQGVARTGTPIVLGAVSTAIAFGVVALMPEPGARDMGLTALIGLLAALALMLSFLPAAWLLLERRSSGVDPPARFHLPGLHAAVAFSLRRPGLVLLAGAGLIGFGITGVPRYELESDLERIISRDMPALKVEDRLNELYGLSPSVYVAPAESLEQARRWSEELRKLPDIARVSSVADLILGDWEQRASAMRFALAQSGGEAREGDLATRLGRALELGPVRIDDIPPALSSGMIGEGGELAVQIVAREGLLDAYELEDQTDRLRAIAPTTTGMPVLSKIIILGRRDYIPPLMGLIFVVVTVLLAATFRSVRDVALSLLPVMVGAAATFGVFCWFGLQFSILTTIVVPVILGLGVDDGIHVVERLRRYPRRTDEAIHEAVEGVGRAIFLTTATTSVSFFGLLFSGHKGMESIGMFMLIGIPMCFVASVTALPAAAKLLRRDSET